jgi:hypothetical protein
VLQTCDGILMFASGRQMCTCIGNLMPSPYS